jgi:hypothetical protein
MPIASRIALNAFIVILAGLSSPPTAPAQETEAIRAYEYALQNLKEHRLQKTLYDIGEIPRIGSPPPPVEEYLKGPSGLGVLGRVYEEEYPLTVPLSSHAWAETPSGKVALKPLWPNGVQTNTCDITGTLIYVGNGDLPRFDRKPIEGNIVVMTFNSGQNWRHAVQLGARAVLFLPPLEAHRTEAEAKWSALPINFPRFWVSENDAHKLLRAVGKRIRVISQQEWTDIKGKNYFAILQGTDPALRHEWIILSAYTDSISVVPSLPHGAEQLCSTATLIELARLLKQKPPRRSVLFLLTSGHFQAMQGVRHFLEKRLQEGWALTEGKTPLFAYCLDLSAGSPTLVATAQGWWLDYRPENIEGERAIARALRNHIPRIAKVFKLPETTLFFDGVNNPDGRHWKNSIPGRYALESEIFNLTGMNSLTFFTAEDARLFQDTPSDTADRIHLPNLLTQARTLYALLHHALNDTQNEATGGDFAMPYRGGGSFKRSSLIAGFGTITGRVLTYDPTRSFIPDVPLPGALVILRNSYRSYMGVRGTLVTRAGKDARYALYGIPLVTYTYEWLRRPLKLWAYVLNQQGTIAFTLDARREYDYPTQFMMTTVRREAPLVLFECTPLEIHGLIDPHLYISYKYATVLDAYNNGEPRRYALDLPEKPPVPETQSEDSAVLFLIPGSKVKFLAGMIPGESRAILTHSTPENEEGEGYDLQKAPEVFRNPSLFIARDIWALNEARRQKLRRYGIVFSSVDLLQESARQEIAKAESALKTLHYTEVESHARAAWGYALRAHPILSQSIQEVLYGLLFYLALALPFSFFLSRLLTSAQHLVHQILYATACFILVFFTLRLLHPAFQITGNTFVIFVAFAMGALSLIVMTFVIGKFEMSLSKQQATQAPQSQSIGKVGIALTALQIALANMRRRKARTTLTCLTLILLTYALLSFTSVVIEIRFNQRPAPGTPRYPGLLLRSPDLFPLEENTYRSLRTEFPEAPIGRRAWLYGAQQGAQSVLFVSGTQGKVPITALLGLDPEEIHLTRPQETLLPGGRWFQKGDVYTAILPQSLAERLRIAPHEVGHTKIFFGGTPFLLIGIADDSKLKNITDLDGENIMPADFGISRELQMRGQGGDVAFRKYIRLDPSMVMIVPAETALRMNADLRSLSVGFASFESATQIMKKIIPRLGLNLYAGVAEKNQPVIQRYSAVPASRTRGLEYVILPILISALIILNTMGASVIERTREIGTLSAIGLAPKHISALFFAEAGIYAVLGAVGGYLLAQIGTRVFASLGLFSGISLNYSSATSLLACGLMFAVVLASTLYPANVAKRIASPGSEKEWFSNPPNEDFWEVPLPFTVARRQTSALATFYQDWFEAHAGYALPDFVSEDISLTQKDPEDITTILIQARCWLAPYDLGVQQTVRLVFHPTDVPDTLCVTLQITRESGDPEHWVNLNHRFLKNVRRQFLYWRAYWKQKGTSSLSQQEKTPSAPPS